ncbi:mannosyl-oligosaccharide 1,2-alpha-mannosidase, partial [Ascoidea rubescens DSM 1968]
MLFKGFIITIFLYFIANYFSLFDSYKNKFIISSKNNNNNSNLSWKERQQLVKNVMKESWAGYEKYAWGKDVYHPVSKNGENMGDQPLGWIIVDSLDTLMIMDLKDELKLARSWVKNELTYDVDMYVNTFETTIRMLGGLLSAYYLSDDDVYIDKATDLANRLMGAFESDSGIPFSSVNLQSKKGLISHADSGASSTAEVSTLQLEFKYLSKLTGEKIYWEKVEHVMHILDNNKPKDGLVPIFIQPTTGKYQGKLIRLGSRGDSYYEYLLKQYIQTGLQEDNYIQMYQESVNGIKKNLVKNSKPNDLTFIGELNNGVDGDLSNKMDHLVCFMGGLLALGTTFGEDLNEYKKKPNSIWTSSKESDLKLAKELTHTCYQMYHQIKETGLSPEIVVFNTDERSDNDFFIKQMDKHNLQRPETVESLFVLYRITKDPIYREYGWEIFNNFINYTKVEGDAGYSSLNDVTKIPVSFRDNMESFWFAETLKYLYLLFDDNEDVLPLDKVVFNTEAHPLPIFDMGEQFKTGWKRGDAVVKPTQEI